MKHESKTLLESYIRTRRFGNLAYQKKDPLRLLSHMYYILVKSQNWRKDNLSKRDTTTDPLCTKFGENREAAHHFISECPAYATVRLDIFCFPYISLTNIITNFGPEN